MAAFLSPAQNVPLRVLVVEDSASLRRMVVNYLKANGFDTCEAWSVQGASEAIGQLRPDIVLLDIILDDGESYDLVSALSETGTPVMVVSSKDTPLDRILCLELGADDFLVKPFELRELLLRMRRLVKLLPRANTPATAKAGAVQYGSFRFDMIERVVTRSDGESSKLTDTEFRLARLLIDNPGVVLDRNRIGCEIFQREYVEHSRSIDVLVSKLRKKIDNPASASVITNVRSTGYVFQILN